MKGSTTSRSARVFQNDLLLISKVMRFLFCCLSFLLLGSIVATAVSAAAADDDCNNSFSTQYHQSIKQLDANLQLNYIVQAVNNNDNDNAGLGGNFTAELILKGRRAWIGFGISDNMYGKMTPGIAIIGLPSSSGSSDGNGGGGGGGGDIAKYYLQGKSRSGVIRMDNEYQTLIGTSIQQNNTHTILKFTKLLNEEGDDDISINPYGENKFIWAYGYSNSLFQHDQRGKLTIDFNTATKTSSSCNNNNNDNSNNNANNVFGGDNDTEDKNSSDSLTAKPTSRPTNVVTTTTITNTNYEPNSSSSNKCDDYQYNLELVPNILTFSYVIILDDPSSSVNDSNGYIKVKIVYNDIGWIGFGISIDGMMISSSNGNTGDTDAIIGLPDEDIEPMINPSKYKLKSKGNKGIVSMPFEQQSLKDTNIEQNFDSKTTILTFTKRLKENNNQDEIPIIPYGHNNFIFAYGSSNTLGYHKGRHSFRILTKPCNSIDLANDFDLDDIEIDFINLLDNDSKETITKSSSSPSSYENYFMVHGIFAFISWCILTPLAISLSLLRQFFYNTITDSSSSSSSSSSPSSTLLLLLCKLHIRLNILSWLCTFISFVIAIIAVGKSSSSSKLLNKNHFTGNSHRIIGLIIFIYITIQILIGFVRPPPSSSHNDNNKHNNNNKSSVSVSTSSSSYSDGAVRSTDTLSLNSNFSIDEEHNIFSDEYQLPEQQQKQLQQNKLRYFWECFHKISGMILLILSWYQINDGIERYMDRYTTNSSNDDDSSPSSSFVSRMSTSYNILVGLFGSIIVILLFKSFSSSSSCFMRKTN